ncbi:PREDICTED: iron-sulfur cluster co-chaperone protein HscB, mitochondrial-like [Priapulus caudatus]|uniref:Iron-sulfur cluster co-chaperone protein HscB, mitochondrial-like n=1 Tax=Priapulus caudatus TaxID=37621 RepID=A0ABM1EYE8_PRICU|nr:PREDICTED: iron-sulfur cluster co-chaperone protein HscB, mitochondrial-like [Priapulus caudatus]
MTTLLRSYLMSECRRLMTRSLPSAAQSAGAPPRSGIHMCVARRATPRGGAPAPRAYVSCLDCKWPPETRECWKCKRVTDRMREMFFCTPCDVVQSPDPAANYFDVMGIAATFDIDLAQLRSRYRDLQTKLHPDKYAQKSDTERAYSALQSTAVNKAYWRLADPLKRGLYLLELNGMGFRDGEVEVDEGFLLDVMETNEAMAAAASVEALAAIGEENEREMAALVRDVAAAFADDDVTRARWLLACMKYRDNIGDKIKQIRQERFGIV